MSGKDSVAAYIAMPEGEGPFPALIVIHEWWGLNDWIKSTTDDLARNGYVSLAIDLYRGSIAGSAEEAHELMRGLPEDRVTKDLKSAFRFLTKKKLVDSERIGSIGWCMGGSYSLKASQVLPSLAASVICYGRLVTEEDELKKIACPILGIFGETDRGIPAASVKIFERTAQKLEKNVRTVVYPNVGHAFMNPNNKNGYDEATTLEAWQRIHAFLKLRLKGK